MLMAETAGGPALRACAGLIHRGRVLRLAACFKTSYRGFIVDLSICLVLREAEEYKLRSQLPSSPLYLESRNAR
jgi:hypothetical protein